ncbi:hypothetical protein BH10PSE7_BH10PSE7_21010 [soil metagenome]
MVCAAHVLRRWSFTVLALIAIILAACSGGGTTPFAKMDGSPSGKPVPPIALSKVNGLPPEKFQALKDALAVSAGKRDMAIVEGAFDQGELTLTGNFQIIPDPAAVRVGYTWTLTDAKGTVLHNISAEEIAPGTPGPDPWIQVTPAVLQRIAAYTSESLSGRLSQLGYATQIGGLPPPIDGFMMAGPGADDEIDLETLNGPGKGDPLESAAAQPAPEAVLVVAQKDDKALLEQTEAKLKEMPPAQAEAPQEPPPPENGGHTISAVAVMPVSGAPGNGNGELTSAMRRTLEDAGWPVLSSPRKDALTIVGSVKLSEKSGTTQKVAVAWTVRSPDGRTLGSIKQANQVPAGSLDDGWGKNADYAAMAAATGIFDLVSKIR